MSIGLKKVTELKTKCDKYKKDIIESDHNKS